MLTKWERNFNLRQKHLHLVTGDLLNKINQMNSRVKPVLTPVCMHSMSKGLVRVCEYYTCRKMQQNDEFYITWKHWNY